MDETKVDHGSDYAAFIEGAAGSEGLARVSKMAVALYRAEAEAAELAEKLKGKLKLVAQLSEIEIPELMDELDLSELKLKNGAKLTVGDTISAKPLAGDRDKVYAFLEKGGHGGLIKRTIAVAFSRDQGKDALKLHKQLEAKGLAVKDERKVEAQTLSKHVRDGLKKGDEFPDYFGVYEARKTSIKGGSGDPF